MSLENTRLLLAVIATALSTAPKDEEDIQATAEQFKLVTEKIEDDASTKEDRHLPALIEDAKAIFVRALAAKEGSQKEQEAVVNSIPEFDEIETQDTDLPELDDTHVRKEPEPGTGN